MMLPSMSRPLLLIPLLAAVATAQNITCTTGDAVHMIVARASLEPPGTGVIGNISRNIQQQFPGSTVEAVQYPATLTNYVLSEAAGVTAMAMLVNSYASACPNSRMVLMGYSQGAQVTADLLCGTSEAASPKTDAVAASIKDKIAAVVLMGDPSHDKNQSFAQGTSTKDGVFPRQNNAGCDPLSSRIVSYCNADDTFCDSGSSIMVHLSYIQNNGTSAVDFVAAKIKETTTSSNSTSGSKSGSETSSASSTANAASTRAGLAVFALVMGAAWLLVV